MALAALRFGSLTLADPSNGYDGYRLIAHEGDRQDVIEVSLPNTAGRLRLVVGRARSEYTAALYEFQVIARFASVAAAQAFWEQVVAASASETTSLRTLYFGHLDESDVFSVDDVAMDVAFGELFRDAAGAVYLEFRARFSRWGSEG